MLRKICGDELMKKVIAVDSLERRGGGEVSRDCSNSF